MFPVVFVHPIIPVPEAADVYTDPLRMEKLTALKSVGDIGYLVEIQPCCVLSALLRQ